MTRALRIVLGIEITLGLIWTLAAAMAHGAGGLAAVGVFFIVYAIFAAMVLFAAWVFWQYPAERRRAGLIIALPVLFWFAPLPIRALAGDYLSSQQLAVLLLLAVLALIALCWIMPKRITRYLPDGLIRSRLLNWLVLLAVIGGWLFFVFVVVGYVATEDKSGTSTGGEALAFAIILAALYLIWLGIGSFVAATWAWLCLRSDTPGTSRKLGIAQLVISLPGVLLGVAVAVWLAGQGHL